MRRSTPLKKVEMAKDLIAKSEIFKVEFIKFFISIIGMSKIDKLTMQVNELLLLFIHDKISLTQQYKRFSKIEDDLFLTILDLGKIPSLIDLVKHLKEIDYVSNGFSIIDFISIVESEAIVRYKSSSNKNNFNFILQNKSASEKALLQSKRLFKKDMNGLLGMYNLSKRENKRIPSDFPRSVWTVKKK